MPTEPSDRDAMMREAARWIIAEEAGLSPAERRRFHDWLRTDPRHGDALRQARAVWGDLGGLSPARNRLPETAAARFFPRRLAMAAAVVLAALWSGGAWWLAAPSWTALTADHRTAIGQTRAIILDDGSTLELSPATAVNLRFTDRERRIDLVEGEVFVTVTPMADRDPRPFVVAAAHGRIQALGTMFDVARHGERVQVTAVEHTIRVSLEDAQDGASTAELSPGQGIGYDGAARRMDQVHDRDAERATAWRRGRLIFDGVPLDQVAADLNRYGETRMLIADPRLGTRLVSGVFDAHRPEAAVAAIQSELKARSIPLPPFAVILF